MNSTSSLAPWYLCFSVLQNPVFFLLCWEVLPLVALGTDTFSVSHAAARLKHGLQI